MRRPRNFTWLTQAPDYVSGTPDRPLGLHSFSPRCRISVYATVVVANSQGAGCSGCRLGRLARYAKIVARSTVPSTKGQGHDAGICQELAEALSPLQSLFNQHNDAG